MCTTAAAPQLLPKADHFSNSNLCSSIKSKQVIFHFSPLRQNLAENSSHGSLSHQREAAAALAALAAMAALAELAAFQNTLSRHPEIWIQARYHENRLPLEVE